MNIMDLRVHVIQEDGTWEWLPVDRSPYYLSLIKYDRAIFDNYISLLMKYLNPIRPVNEITYEQFIKLMHDIDTGYNLSLEPKITVQNSIEVLDGQHRLSILMYIYEGSNIYFDIIDNKVEGMWVE